MTPGNKPDIRLDYQIILQLVATRSRVLDLGCGDGELLYHLIHQKQCQGTGIEIDEKAIYSCIERGVTVLHSDIITGLKDFSDKRFDYVILNESLQQVLNPQAAILAALRVGKNVIVGIPNFCHMSARFQIFFRGRVPVTAELPYEWYNTPNLRFFSLKDFRSFCRNNAITIVKERDLGRHQEEHLLPNLFAHIGIFLLRQ